MLKRMISLLAVLAMMLGCAASVNSEEAVVTGQKIEMESFPFFIDGANNRAKVDFPLFFADGVKDLPFVELNYWATLMNQLIPLESPDLNRDYQLTLAAVPEQGVLTMTRENGSQAVFDFSEGTILWNDYDAFIQDANGPYQHLAALPALNAEGKPNLLSPVTTLSKHGDAVLLNLRDYEIPMLFVNGLYLVPLQTMSAFMLSPFYAGMYFNRESVILAAIANMKAPVAQLQQELEAHVQPETVDELVKKGMSPEDAFSAAVDMFAETDEGKEIIAASEAAFAETAYSRYSRAPEGERSEELTRVGYKELLLELDSFYGLKETHHIGSFEQYLFKTSLIEPLAGPSVKAADAAIGDLTGKYLDDGHSAFISPSYLEPDLTANYFVSGLSSSRGDSLSDRLTTLRNKYPESAKYYYEVGNTAYVCLNSFEINLNTDYYKAAAEGTLPDPSTDTVSLIIQAHQQITRENSPIENVVLDLSANDGGAAPAAIYTVAWFLGQAPVSVYNTFTGAETTSVYQADINLDHRYDEKDTLSHLHLFCLTSPISFSCGNLVPWAFKEDGRVTLMGRATGGGSCVVFPMTTAWGTSFQISGNRRLSFVKNGAYYDVDQGVEPDIIIESYEHFYDRQKLTDYINSLF